MQLVGARADHELAESPSGAKSHVNYAYEGGDQMLAVADAAHERLNARLDDHCERPDYSPFIEYCR